MILSVGFVGNVDQGKTSFIDCLFSTKYINLQPGEITQNLRVKVLQSAIVKNILKNYKSAKELNLSSFLLIDTPGHGYFKSIHDLIYKITDLIFLFQDIRQTTERTIEIIQDLQKFNCKFIIILTKIDLIPGWKKYSQKLITNINLQEKETNFIFNQYLDKFIIDLHSNNIYSEIFFRASDDATPIFPISAITHEGIAEIFLYLSLKKQLENIKQTKCFLLDQIQSTKFLFLCFEKIKINQKYFLGDQKLTIEKIFDFSNTPVTETEYKHIYLIKFKQEVKNSILGSILHHTPIIPKIKPYGVILKADGLGKLSALELLAERLNIPVLQSSVYPIKPRDLFLCNNNVKPEHKLILCLSDTLPKLKTSVTILHSSVIYKLEEAINEHLLKIQTDYKNKLLKKVIFPCRVNILKNCIFKKTNPFIIGVEIQFGTLKIGYSISVDQKFIFGVIKNIELNNKKVSEATEYMQVAIEIETNNTIEALLKYNYFDVYIIDCLNELKELESELNQKQKENVRQWSVNITN